MFKCFKKKEVVGEIIEETRYYIPKEYALEICKLSDLTANQKKKREAKFRLWNMISSIFPSLNIKEGGWELVFANSTTIYITKHVDLD